MEESDDPVPHYEGNRNLNVLSGSFSSDAKSIQGTLELNLPVGLKILNLTQADIGKPQSVVFNGKASKLTLKTLDDQSVAIDCNSSDDCLGDIQGVDDQGGLISNDGLNSNTNATDDGSREYSAHFGSNISGVAVYVPADSFTASYPFNLTVGQNNVPASNSSASQGATSQSTGSQSPSSQGQVSAADRSAIIQAILNMEQVMATKDPAQIRAYLEKDLSNSSDSATELSQIKNAPDSEILLASAAINLEQVTGTQLESPSTQITLSSDGNTATVIITSGNSKTTLKINKVNGIWY
jgi:hypothetical protein